MRYVMNSKVYVPILLILWPLFFHMGCVSLPPPPPRAQLSAAPLTLSALIIAGRLVQQTERGEIRVIRKGQSLSPVYAGIPLEKGDQVSTAQNAEAVIDYEHGIRAYLGRNTQVSLSSLWASLNEVLVRIPDYFFQVKGFFDLATSVSPQGF